MNYKKQMYPTGENVIWYENNEFLISFIDPSPGNTDYESYLQWLAEGNEPEIIELESN